MMVMAVIGIFAAIAIPSFTRQKKVDWKLILNEVNNLASIARQETIITPMTTCRLSFSNADEIYKIVVEKQQTDAETGKISYAQLNSSYFQTEYQLPKNLIIKAAYLNTNKPELFAENKGKAFCYMAPCGLSQELMVHVAETSKDAKNEIHKTLHMLPFFSKFELLDDWIKPEKSKP